MIPFKCCVCLEPSHELPQDFKAVFSDFMRLINKFQSSSLNCIQLDELTFCKACRNYFVQIHQFKHQLRFKQEICNADKSFLRSKIRRAQSSSVDRGKVPTCNDFEIHISTSPNHEDNSEVNSQNEGGTIMCLSEHTDNSDIEPDESCRTAEVIATKSLAQKEPEDDADQPQANSEESSPILLSLFMAPTEDHTRHSPQPPSSILVKNTDSSDVESIDLYEITDVIAPTTDNVSIGTSSPDEQEPEEATPEDTSDSDFEPEPTKTKTQVEDVPISASTAVEEPNAATSSDTNESNIESESESEPEPYKKRRVTSRYKRLPKKKSTSSGWRRIRSSNIQRLSKTDFTYMNKYPFERTAIGYNCGLCSGTYNFHNGSKHNAYFMLKHIHEWHISNIRLRATKVPQRFTEIAPNRFQYGKYKVQFIDGSYRCEECGEIRAAKTSGIKAANIMHHIRKHHENPFKRYTCDQCGKAYRTRLGLSEHKKTKHQSSVGQFPCTKCGKTFATRGRASVHEIVVHGTKKEFICEICGKVCSQKANLASHIAFVHDKQKFECSDCDKIFGSKYALGIHRHCHLGTKFVCDICGMEFSQPSSITRHKKTAHRQ